MSDGRGLTSALSMVVGLEFGRRDVAQHKRLDRAISRYFDTGETTDEINPPND